MNIDVDLSHSSHYYFCLYLMCVTFCYSSTCKMHINPYTKARLHAAVVFFFFFFLPNQSLWSVLDMTGFDDICNSIFHFIFDHLF